MIKTFKKIKTYPSQSLSNFNQLRAGDGATPDTNLPVDPSRSHVISIEIIILQTIDDHIGHSVGLGLPHSLEKSIAWRLFAISIFIKTQLSQIKDRGLPRCPRWTKLHTTGCGSSTTTFSEPETRRMRC